MLFCLIQYSGLLDMFDLLIKDGYIITMAPNRQVFKRGSIAVVNGKIVAVGENVKGKAEKIIDARGKVVLPGLVNGHTHLPMVLLRGVADDMPLKEWLSTKIWPIEKNLSAKDCHVGALLGCVEMIRSGTTCFADQYFHMDKVARGVEEAGIRGVLSYGIIELDDIKKRKQEISIGENLVKSFQGKADGRILTMFGPHAPYTCSTDCLAEVKELAKKHAVGIHIHISETRDEIEQTIEKYGKRPVEYLDSIGFLGPEVLAAHCVWLSDNEIKLLRNKEVKPVHNPVSNMKIGCGAAPVQEMLVNGIPIALGTDGAASNNSLDMFEEMKFAALLSKVHKLDPVVVPAISVLEMATINGATALGLQEEIGSLEAGKKADLITVDMKKPHLTPIRNVVSHLVYSSLGSDVDTVVVDGKVLMQGRKLITLNETKVLERAQRTSDDLLARMGELNGN